MDKIQLWSQVLEHIKKELNSQTFDTWFTPTKPAKLTEDMLTIEVPNKFFKDWLVDHYIDLVANALGSVSAGKVKPQFVVATAMDTAMAADDPQAIRPFKARPLPSASPDAFGALELNPKFTFDGFVIGPSNRFAHAAALAVAQSPAKAYNPLFIYGGVGLGKTHLMQAIGHHIAQKQPDVKVVYISSEKFTNQLISAIQHRTTSAFRQLYRSVDVLLVDDIQFIAGKESTQEEFFHTFNTLYDSHKQIVISSDRPPKEIPTLEKRLVSRFEWGLTTEVQAPDLETRIAILRKKSELESIAVPNDVTFFIAEKVKSNIRELEGALIRVVAYTSLVGANITVETAKEVLKDLVKEEAAKITVDLIQKKVANYFDVRLSDMKAKRRTKQVVYPRQIAMYLARELTDYSLPEIGEYFGGRDHTTVLHACMKMQESLKKDQSLRDLLNRLVADIKG